MVECCPDLPKYRGAAEDACCPSPTMRTRRGPELTQGTNNTSHQCPQRTGNSGLPEASECPESEAVSLVCVWGGGGLLRQGGQVWSPEQKSGRDGVIVSRGQSCPSGRGKPLATAASPSSKKHFVFNDLARSRGLWGWEVILRGGQELGLGLLWVQGSRSAGLRWNEQTP